ncbi:hypothetical protein CRUP_002018 [Coryphaenoides rupestris]|nr:hypothetical protein CRUP_002018 [Coryphaenoides rupestris]
MGGVRRRWVCWPAVPSTAVLYGSLALFVSILHNVFLLYYVETFVSVYKIDKVSFWVGEAVFLIWNSLNDPLFGWLSDRSFLSSPHGLRLQHYYMALFGVSFIAPHLNNLYFLTLCQRHGVYRVVRWLFVLKLALSVVMLLAGADHVYLLCVFIASNRVFTEGTCKLLNLVVSDLVDEDFVLNRRRQAASALLFGMVALVTKPGQTLAPLVGTWLLCFYTGYDIFERRPAQQQHSLSAAVAPPEVGLRGPALAPVPGAGTGAPLRLGCFYMLVAVPIVCALLQLSAWSRFTLHGRKLQGIKTQRQGAQHGHLADVKAI